MHPALTDFFDTHGTTSAKHKRAVHDQLAPIMVVVHESRAHATELEHKLQIAELQAHDHRLDDKMEWMHGRIRIVEQRAAALQAAGRDLARAMVDLEAAFSAETIEAARMLSGSSP
jgi:hypothetical protein